MQTHITISHEDLRVLAETFVCNIGVPAGSSVQFKVRLSTGELVVTVGELMRPQAANTVHVAKRAVTLRPERLSWAKAVKGHINSLINAGMTLDQISHRCNVAPQSLGRWVNGKSVPRNEQQVNAVLAVKPPVPGKLGLAEKPAVDHGLSDAMVVGGD